MNNAETFHLPLKAKVVKPSESDALESRRVERLAELAREGWRPRKGWAVEDDLDATRPA